MMPALGSRGEQVQAFRHGQRAVHLVGLGVDLRDAESIAIVRDFIESLETP